MRRSTVLFVVVGSLIGIGIVLSFYGSQLITADLVTGEQNLASGDLLEVRAELDPSISETAVFVVQVADFDQVALKAKIIDPLGSQVISKPIDRESYEDKFEISSAGTYTLLIENTGQGQSQVLGVIGHMPDISKLSVGVVGFYVLIVGLVGVVGFGIYIVRTKRKKRIN